MRVHKASEYFVHMQSCACAATIKENQSPVGGGEGSMICTKHLASIIQRTHLEKGQVEVMKFENTKQDRGVAYSHTLGEPLRDCNTLKCVTAVEVHRIDYRTKNQHHLHRQFFKVFMQEMQRVKRLTSNTYLMLLDLRLFRTTWN